MEVYDEVDSPRIVGEISRQLDVSTPLTPAPDHLSCLDLGGCVEEVSELLNYPVMCLLVAEVCHGQDVITVEIGIRSEDSRRQDVSSCRSLVLVSRSLVLRGN